MSAEIIEKRSGDSVERVAEMLKSGKTGVFPCDTIYGLQASADEEMASKLYDMKRRPQNKSFITLISLDDLKKTDLEVPEILYGVWPAALTAILRAPDGTTHAVRVPSDPFLMKLLPLTGPLYSTSVNFSGEASLLSFADIRPVFDDLVDFIVRDDSVHGGRPSTLVSFVEKPYRVLRQGDFDATELLK